MKKTYLLIITLVIINFSGFSTVWTVVNSGFTFSPGNITIDFGDSVQFTIGGAHIVREVSQTTWDANGNTALSGGFETAAGGGLLLPASLLVGTHYYVCVPHASMGMKGMITVNPSSANIKQNEKLSFSLYPNPTNGIFQINLAHNQENRVYKIEIYNLLGEVVFQTKNIYNQNIIDFTNQNKGIYFVKLYSSDAVLTKKIIFQ